eukprot:CAMPEP_0183293438 /NCGR_PEP_ID=MMETSP0160_2-20130417/2123_1 /TAXON_ID=2839 ORGANISM="Odontella Sinensis, Strain Grunow 1884" /NCGR_SAMPLE_ID=MMETSP0160_2 /ASSEMBLY_ACC=CAM_ASM_000250 /LENGTH=247 /DNA_ID=CAMNT_0025454555 /DNA_START=26 /DNA_END=769 /DNA_ORIENTATION=+
MAALTAVATRFTMKRLAFAQETATISRCFGSVCLKTPSYDESNILVMQNRGGPILHMPRSMSSESGGVLDKIKDKMDERADRKQREKISETYLRMANAEVWTLNAFIADLDSMVSSMGWRQYVPGMGDTKQVEQVKKIQKAVKAVQKELGGEKTPEDIATMSKIDKLKVSVNQGVPVDDVESVVKQFTTMGLMQRLLRHLKLNGKPIPKTESGMRRLMQTDLKHVLTKEEKRAMKKSQARESKNQFY